MRKILTAALNFVTSIFIIQKQMYFLEFQKSKLEKLTKKRLNWNIRVCGQYEKQTTGWTLWLLYYTTK